MDATALLLSPLQFAFTISFHIIFPSFSIGLGAWLIVLEALYLKTGRPAFMMWGEGLFVFPLMLIYNVIAYSVSRGKVAASSDHY